MLSSRNWDPYFMFSIVWRPYMGLTFPARTAQVTRCRSDMSTVQPWFYDPSYQSSALSSSKQHWPTAGALAKTSGVKHISIVSACERYCVHSDACKIITPSSGHWSVSCPSTTSFSKLVLKLGNQLQFKYDLEQNTFWNILLASVQRLRCLIFTPRWRQYTSIQVNLWGWQQCYIPPSDHGHIAVT
jgi:hypothetical protein